GEVGGEVVEEPAAGLAGGVVVDDLVVVCDKGAAIGNASAAAVGNADGGVVCDDALVERDRAAGAAAHAIAACDAAAAGAGVVIDGAVVEGQARGDAEDAAAAAARRGPRVPAHLTPIDRGGCAEAVSDPPACVRGEVMGHDGAVERQRAGEVQDAATRAGRHHPRYVPAGDGDSVEGERPARSAV